MQDDNANVSIPLNKMRKFHNYIKKKYINLYATKPTKLLDLASGKGGDLNKWKINKNIKYVTGYDIDENSVIQAKNRLKQLNIQKPIEFYIQDLSKTVINCKEKYDIITSYFAFHYFFKSYKALKTILSSINNCSKLGSILLLTLFDGNKLRNIKTDNYTVTILDPHKKNNYNKRVLVYIKGSVLDNATIEYIVDPKFLEKKLNEIGFRLIDTKLFSEIENNNIKLTNSEKKISFMNRIYIFKKII